MERNCSSFSKILLNPTGDLESFKKLLNPQASHKNSLGLEVSRNADLVDSDNGPVLDQDVAIEEGIPRDHFDNNKLVPIRAAIKGIKGKKRGEPLMKS